MLELQVGVAKIGKYATPESGDTLEMIERPHGGFSFVLADGQGSGRGAKTLSNLVTTRAISMLKDGARDGAVARAVHDYLYAYRHGQVSATLNIVSVDLNAKTVLISRNNQCPFYVIDENGTTTYNEPSTPIGLYPMTKPIITQIDLRPYLYVVVFTDGIIHAGRRYNESIELDNYLGNFNVMQGRSAQAVTDEILLRAIELDRNRPTDDMSVIVLAALPMDGENKVRRMTVTFPVERA
ncbi:MAG: SpoIIE family protein phosphatase [Herpetosiphon sp.]|nr:SpoIIE family protein phosphatase [Herpetosiphon sp.]